MGETQRQIINRMGPLDIYIYTLGQKQLKLPFMYKIGIHQGISFCGK